MNSCFLRRRPAAIDPGVKPGSFPVVDEYALVVVILGNEPPGPPIRSARTHGPPDVFTSLVLVQIVVLVVLGVDVRLLLGQQLVEGLAFLLLLRRAPGSDRCRPALRSRNAAVERVISRRTREGVG